MDVRRRERASDRPQRGCFRVQGVLVCLCSHQGPDAGWVSTLVDCQHVLASVCRCVIVLMVVKAVVV